MKKKKHLPSNFLPDKAKIIFWVAAILVGRSERGNKEYFNRPHEEVDLSYLCMPL
jgi:hypothetical protein